MSETPLEDLGPMVKTESTFMRDETPELYKRPNCAPANLENMAFVTPFSSYMLSFVIIERKIEIGLLCLIHFSFRDQSRQNSLSVCFNSISQACTLLYVGK